MIVICVDSCSRYLLAVGTSLFALPEWDLPGSVHTNIEAKLWLFFLITEGYTTHYQLHNCKTCEHMAENHQYPCLQLTITCDMATEKMICTWTQKLGNGKGPLCSTNNKSYQNGLRHKNKRWLSNTETRPQWESQNLTWFKKKSVE
jgi:arsenate reductase-like glutaredoxin family protein